jgi:hypothetical protein
MGLGVEHAQRLNAKSSQQEKKENTAPLGGLDTKVSGSGSTPVVVAVTCS